MYRWLMRSGMASGLALMMGSAFAAELLQADRIAVEALAGAADAAWNARDYKGLSAMYVEDGTLQVSGTAVEGVGAIHEYFRKSFARLDPAMRHITQVTGLHPQSNDVVLADTLVRLVRQDAQGEQTVREFSTVTVVVRRDGQWKLSGVRAYPLPARSSAE